MNRDLLIQANHLTGRINNLLEMKSRIIFIIETRVNESLININASVVLDFVFRNSNIEDLRMIIKAIDNQIEILQKQIDEL